MGVGVGVGWAELGVGFIGHLISEDINLHLTLTHHAIFKFSVVSNHHPGDVTGDSDVELHHLKCENVHNTDDQ